ncbi:hypothetical protein ERO13_A13G162214v2 [Gossypium hirsutum]|nr:hypothetical protein ERO13_A13G162214v2 [Gossypium hirsutum]
MAGARKEAYFSANWRVGSAFDQRRQVAILVLACQGSRPSSEGRADEARG